jgi:hypothetical protein
MVHRRGVTGLSRRARMSARRSLIPVIARWCLVRQLHPDGKANRDANRAARRDGRGCLACPAVNRAARRRSAMANRDANRAVRRGGRGRSARRGGRGCLACPAVNRAAHRRSAMAIRDVSQAVRRGGRGRSARPAVNRAIHRRSATAIRDVNRAARRGVMAIRGANRASRRGVKDRSARQDARATLAVNRAARHRSATAIRGVNRAVRRDAGRVARPCRPALPHHQMAGGIGSLPVNHPPGRDRQNLCGRLAAVAHVPRLRAGVNEYPPADPPPGRLVGDPDRRLTGLVRFPRLEQAVPVGRSHPAAAGAQTDSDAIRGMTVLPLPLCLVRCRRGAASHLAAQTNFSNLTSNQPQLNSGISEYPTQS